MDNELLLFDRINVIKDTIAKYGEEKCYLSFSGGKDSTILHYLLDLAIPNNTIPRVFINTGIEYNSILNFVKDLASKDERFVIIKPSTNIKKMLDEKGYPFKSKEHSHKLDLYKNGSRAPSILEYKDRSGFLFKCPKMLKYQFEEDLGFKVSDKCCNELKKKPVAIYERENGKRLAILGLRKAEAGHRANMKGCISTSGNKVHFSPLLVVSDEWENWFIEKHDIKLCELYYPPFNFKRTGCKGCPFSLDLQDQLEIMSRYLPNERLQCEMIFKPVYEEYRKLGYRLSKIEQIKII